MVDNPHLDGTLVGMEVGIYLVQEVIHLVEVLEGVQVAVKVVVPVGTQEDLEAVVVVVTRITSIRLTHEAQN